MRFWLKILSLILAIFAAGVVTGFSISPSYLNQARGIGQAVAAIPVSAIIGAGVAMWKTITEWYRENVLEYDGLFVKQQPYSIGGKHINYPAYYLRIKRTRGKGRAEDCEGIVTIEGTEMNRNSMWEGGLQYVPIGIHKYLKLFEIHEYDDHKNLVFRANPANSLDQIWHDEIPYTNELDDRKVTVRLGSSNANLPKPYTKTIGEIIESAKPE